MVIRKLSADVWTSTSHSTVCENRARQMATLANPAGDLEAVEFLAVDRKGGGGVGVHVNDDLDGRVVPAKSPDASYDEWDSLGKAASLPTAKAPTSMSSTWSVPRRLFMKPRCQGN